MACWGAGGGCVEGPLYCWVNRSAPESGLVPAAEQLCRPRPPAAPPAAAGPAMMPGGDPAAYAPLQAIVEKVAAQTDDGACVTYIGPGGAGGGAGGVLVGAGSRA